MTNKSVSLSHGNVLIRKALANRGLAEVREVLAMGALWSWYAFEVGCKGNQMENQQLFFGGGEGAVTTYHTHFAP